MGRHRILKCRDYTRKKMRLLIGLIIVGLISCDAATEKSKEDDFPLSGQELAFKKEIDEIIKNTDLTGALDRFHLSFGDSLKTSVNQFIFLAQNTFDTSFVLMLERRPEMVKAVYYQTIPLYHFNTPYLDDEIDLTYFDGFSFKTDTATWNLIINESKKLLKLKDSIEFVGQVDGSSYMLSYNSEIKLCRDPYNTNLGDQFKGLESLIKSKLMRDVYKRKVDIRQQAGRGFKKQQEKERAGTQHRP